MKTEASATSWGAAVKTITRDYGRDIVAGILIAILVIASLLVNLHCTSFIKASQAMAAETQQHDPAEPLAGEEDYADQQEQEEQQEQQEQTSVEEHFEEQEEPADLILNGPLLAIVIDDLGWSSPAAKELFGMGYPFTVAVIPFTPSAREDSIEAFNAGCEVFAHIPMETINPAHLGWLKEHAIKTSMSEEEIITLMSESINAIPNAKGFNNHMGSKASSHKGTMEAVVAFAKDQGLVVLDSMTIPNSVLAKVAIEMKVGVAVNSLFIDNEKTEEDIRARLLEAAYICRNKGKAVVIGHMHPATVQALKNTLPGILKKGINLVTVSQMIVAQPVQPSSEDITEIHDFVFKIPQSTGLGSYEVD